MNYRQPLHLVPRLLVALALVVTPLLTTAGDWPTYLHDAQRTAGSGDETILSPSNAGHLTELWAFKTGGVIAASATIVNNTVYVGSWDGYEYALNAATGAMLWKTYLGITTMPNCNPPSAGVSAAAAVQGGVVYVGGGDAYWYALDAATGNVLWKVYTGDNSPSGGHYNWASPLIYNGYAYIGIASFGDCPLVQGQLLQVSLSTHQIINTFNFVPNGTVGGGIWTSPSIDTATNTIYVTTGTIVNYSTQPLAQALVALDASTLTLKNSWQLPAAQAVTDSDWGTTPTMFSNASNNPLVTANNKNGFVYAYDRTDLGAGPLWQTQIANGGACPQCGDGSLSSSAFGQGQLYVAGGNTSINGIAYHGSVRALNPATGAYLWQHGAPGTILQAIAYANDLVIDGAGSTVEVLNATTGATLYSYQTGGTIYGAPSVSNGRIFAGSTDGNLYTFGLPNPCPSGWSCADIGSPALTGNQSLSNGVWTVQGGGNDIWGVADQFHYVWQSLTGDGAVSAHITAQANTSGWAKAGVMLRALTDPGAAFYDAVVTPGNGVSIEYRAATGGYAAEAVRPAGAVPLYLEVARAGSTYTAYTSADGVTWTAVPNSSVTLNLPSALLAGLAVTSHNATTLGSATFDAVSVTTTASPTPTGTSTATPTRTATPTNTPMSTSTPSPTIAPTNTPTGTPTATPSTISTSTPTPSCPSGWSCADIGGPAVAGSQSLSNGVWTVRGAGRDIWNNPDQFRYAWQTLNGNGGVSAHITAQANTNGWAKAGVMLRASTGAGAPFYDAVVTPGNGVHVQYRATQYGGGVDRASVTGKVPLYLEVARAGSTYTAYTSADGVTWTAVPNSSVTLNLPSALLAGLAVTSHNATTLGSATFDAVMIP